MSAHTRAYRACVRAYPPQFRREFADDLTHAFDDLRRDLGPARAWRRTLLDLAVTLPRYRLESLMEPRRTVPTLTVVAIVLIALGVTSVLVTSMVVGAVLIPIGIWMALTQRRARSTRAPDPDRRRRLLRRAMLLAVTCVVTTTVAWIELSVSEDWHGGKLMAYNALFFVTAFGAIANLVVGLRTPRAPRTPRGARGPAITR